MEEDIIVRSPRGQVLSKLLQDIKHMDHDLVVDISHLLISKVNICLHAGKKHKLPSLAQGAVWSAFHKLRIWNSDLKKAWTAFISGNPLSHHHEQELALQIILDRLLKQMLKIKADTVRPYIATKESVNPLTLFEKNAVRYMAGYIAVKLMKKFRKYCKNPTLRSKHELFLCILKKMKAKDQPGEPESVLDYTTLWLELVDRGGLYHIDDNVFMLMESIEMVLRQHLNIPDVLTYVPGTDLRKHISKDVLENHDIMILWETIADIPDKYEQYSVELLVQIIDLWITIRSHSFVKGWTMNFEAKYKEGTRKSLMPEKA